MSKYTFYVKCTMYIHWQARVQYPKSVRGARRPTGIYAFFKNTHQSEQLLLKQEVLLGNLLVKAKSLAVSVMSNSSLKKITWAFLRFYLYFLFKINIFKMQLLKNDTANLVAFNIFWSHFISSFRKSCPLWCIILKKINFQKIFGLVGRRVGCGGLGCWPPIFPCHPLAFWKWCIK